MRAAFIEGFGGPDRIRYDELPDPVPGPGQVLVRPEAVAVDSVDTYVRSGAWPTPVTFPLAVGRDLAGPVAATGPDVTEFGPGDRVWTNSAGYDGRPGATAELAVVAQERLYRLPGGADPVPFVAAVHPAATAYGALIRRARLRPGETVAVAAAGGGVDVLVDTTGQLDLGAAAAHLNPRGRIVAIAGRGRRIDVDQWSFYTRELQLLGFIMSAMTVGELAAAAAWINVHTPAVSVGPVLTFADAARAHTLMEAGELPRRPDRTVGRLVLTP